MTASTNAVTRPRRGRPSRSQARAIDRSVLDAARSCFIERGYDAATMDEIAEQAGVTKATLYTRHESKSALLNAVIEDRIAAWGSKSAQTRWMLGDTLAERLAHYGRSMLAWSRNDELASLSRLLRGEGHGADTIGRNLHSKLRTPMIALLTEEFEVYAEKDAIPVREPQRAAIVFLGMLLGYSMAIDEGKSSPEEEARYVEQIVEIFMNGRKSW